MKPLLRCVLQHWYELRPAGEKKSEENVRRFTSVKVMEALARQQGTGGLRSSVLSSIKGTKAPSEVEIILGAGLFTDELRIETYVRQSLNHANPKFRVASTYAALFYFDVSQEMTSILSERIVLAEEPELLVLACRDALGIWSDVRSGGRCSRCGPMDTQPSTPKQLGWEIRRESSK